MWSSGFDLLSPKWIVSGKKREKGEKETIDLLRAFNIVNMHCICFGTTPGSVLRSHFLWCSRSQEMLGIKTRLATSKVTTSSFVLSLWPSTCIKDLQVIHDRLIFYLKSCWSIHIHAYGKCPVENVIPRKKTTPPIVICLCMYKHIHIFYVWVLWVLVYEWL